MSGHYTADEWDDYVRANFGTVPEAEAFRNANNVFVDGLPEPKYTGPLSTGGFAGVRNANNVDGLPEPKYTGPLSTGGFAGVQPQAQGVSTVDPEEEIDMAQGALPGPASFQNVNAWSGAMNALTAEQIAEGQKQQSAQKELYDRARAAILERRYGPTSAEQWFALSAAIGTPMVRPSFGGVMRNVSSAMGGFDKAKREAEAARADALLELEQSYLSGTSAAKAAELKARLAAMAPQGAVLERIARVGEAKYVPVGDRFQQVPGTGNNLGILTPDQLLVARSDPRNKGKTFYTQDGRPGVIN